MDYFIVEILIVALIVGMAIYGIKHGFWGTYGEIIGVILAFGLGIAIAGVLVFIPFTKFGFVQTMGDSMYKQLGGDNTLFEFVGKMAKFDFSTMPSPLNTILTETLGDATLTNSQQIARYLAILVLFLLTAIISTIIMRILLRKLQKKWYDWRNRHKVYKVIDGTIGCILTTATAAVIVAVLIALPIMLPKVFPNMNEVYQSGLITRPIYNLLKTLLGNLNLTNIL